MADKIQNCGQEVKIGRFAKNVVYAGPSLKQNLLNASFFVVKWLHRPLPQTHEAFSPSSKMYKE